MGSQWREWWRRVLGAKQPALVTTLARQFCTLWSLSMSLTATPCSNNMQRETLILAGTSMQCSKDNICERYTHAVKIHHNHMWCISDIRHVKLVLYTIHMKLIWLWVVPNGQWQLKIENTPNLATFPLPKKFGFLQALLQTCGKLAARNSFGKDLHPLPLELFPTNLRCAARKKLVLENSLNWEYTVYVRSCLLQQSSLITAWIGQVLCTQNRKTTGWTKNYIVNFAKAGNRKWRTLQLMHYSRYKCILRQEKLTYIQYYYYYYYYYYY